MRKMQEYRLKGKGIFIGLEDSKRSWKLCVRSEGMIIHETSMPARFEVLHSYLRGSYPECKIKVMYEAGFGGFWLCDLLRQEGIDCIVTPAHKVTQEKVNKVKTDRVDARRLALNLEKGDYVCCSVPDRERREDRQISRTLSQMQDTIKTMLNRIRKFLDYHGLNGEMAPGAWKRWQYRNLRTMKLGESLQICMEAYLDALEKLEEIESGLLVWMKELSKKERYREAVKSKESCPGIGRLTATRLTLEWGDLSRFSGGKQLASYTGLTSSEYSTGEMVHRGRITGQGSGRIRSWLIQSAWRAVALDPVMTAKFQRVWKNSGSKKKGIVAVARKLAVRIRAVELSGRPYAVAVIE